MRRPRSGAMVSFAAALSIAASAAAGPLPSAREVVVRGKSTLDAALQAAVAPARDGGRAGLEVALIVDVTPYTAGAERLIMEALRGLDSRGAGAAAWRIAALGGRFGDPAFAPSAVALEVPRVLREKRLSENTIADLERTISTLPTGHAVIVYLADWHFEDDDRLERLADSLERRSLVFSVVGSEAAFSRAWNDGFFANVAPDARGGNDRYDARIGRNPFGSCRPESPWHGGDTAYPHLPAHMAGAPWTTEFVPGGLPEDLGLTAFDPDAPAGQGMEDLRERLQLGLQPSRSDTGPHPLPSSFGPYGLMRLAALTGGRYVLWSWNPSGRSSVRYDYTRCDRFPPDLRPRSAILAEIARRPLARALLDAWHGIADRRVGLARITPPVARDRVSPREMAETTPDCCLCMSWSDEAQYRRFLRDIARVLDALDECIGTLDAAIERTAERPDDADLRLLADAHLFRHMLVVQRFSLGEAAAAAKHIPADAWDHPDLYPALFCDEFLLRGSDPAKVIPRTERIFDAEQAKRVTEDRKAMLERYRGTPFGETVARNDVVTYRFGYGRKVIRPPADGSRNPAQSEQNEGPTTQPGGGSRPAPPPASGG